MFWAFIYLFLKSRNLNNKPVYNAILLSLYLLQNLWYLQFKIVLIVISWREVQRLRLRSRVSEESHVTLTVSQPSVVIVNVKKKVHWHVMAAYRSKKLHPRNCEDPRIFHEIRHYQQETWSNSFHLSFPQIPLAISKRFLVYPGGPSTREPVSIKWY